MFNTQFISALIMGFFVGGVTGYLGTLMLSKRMSLAGCPLGHLTLPGIALALIYGFDISLGAFIFLAFGILFIWLLEIRTKLPLETLTAVVFVASLAVAFLFLPEEDIEYALIGDISRIPLTATIFSVLISLAVFFVIRKIFPQIILANISEDIAKAEGINVKKYNLIYLICVALAIVLGVRIVGGLMTAALVAIPAAASKNISRNLSQYAYGGMAIGALGCVLGIIGFQLTAIPAGLLIIIASSFLFLISLIFKR